MKLYSRLTVTLLLMAFTLSCNNNSEALSDKIPTVARSQFMKLPADWRNLRYAEVIPVFKQGTKLHIEVYNTLGCNDAPQEPWNLLNAEKMAEEYEAQKVILNGPRYWVLNQIEARGKSINNKTVNFGGIEMVLRATLESNIFSAELGTKLYEENEVQRETTFHFWKDNEVYELTSPTGDVYRMQSYTTMRDPSLSIENLANLDEKINLPEGWSFRTRTLTENEILTANGVAYVINDDLGNSYQKVTH